MNRRITVDELAKSLKRSKMNVDTSAGGKLKRTYQRIGEDKADVYASERECRYAVELDVMLKAGAIRRWERQVKYVLAVNGVHIGTYRADFEVYEFGLDKPRTIDVKGYMTEPAKYRIKLMKAIHGIEVEIVQ